MRLCSRYTHLASIFHALRIASAHHVASQSFLSVARFAAFLLRPNRHNHRSQIVCGGFSFARTSPSRDQRQLRGIIFELCVGETSRLNFRSEFNWLIQFQDGNIIIECHNIEVFMLMNFLHPTNLRVIGGDVMPAQVHSQRGPLEIVYAMGCGDYVFVRDDSGSTVYSLDILTPQTNHPRIFIWFRYIATYNATVSAANTANCKTKIGNEKEIMSLSKH